MGQLQDGVIDIQGVVILDASIPQRPDPDDCSCQASTVIRRPLLVAPRTKTDLARCAFSVAAPTTWNSLPSDIRACRTLTTFKKHLKTYLFR